METECEFGQKERHADDISYEEGTVDLLAPELNFGARTHRMPQASSAMKAASK